MTNFSFQFNAHEVAPATGNVVIPKGDYDVIFDSCEIKPTSSGNGGFIECRYKVMAGEHKDALLFDRLNLWNPNEQAVNIARAQLSALCHVTGVFVLSDGANTMNQQMKNKPFKVHVDVSLNDKKEAVGNAVKRIMNADGSLPGRATPAAPASAPAANAAFTQQAAPASAPAQQAWAPPAPQTAPVANGGGFGQAMASPPNAPWLKQ